MTRQSNDGTGTEFSHWLRKQPEIESEKGFVTTNLDFIWQNYKTRQWMLIEEKRHMTDLRFPQPKFFKLLDTVSKRDPDYKGFHFIQFEETNPEDGKIYVDGVEVTKEGLIQFLRFEADEEKYRTYEKIK